MFAVLQIESVGTSSFWEGLAGPALIAVAAVAASIVAARTANHRQREQLAHDLAVRRNEDIRDALDESVKVIHETAKKVTDLRDPIVQLESLEHDMTGSHVAVEAVALEINKEARERLLEMIGCKVRLALRLGRDDEIPSAVDELRDAWQIETNLYMLGLKRKRTEDEKLQTAEALRRSDAAYTDVHRRFEDWMTQGR